MLTRKVTKVNFFWKENTLCKFNDILGTMAYIKDGRQPGGKVFLCRPNAIHTVSRPSVQILVGPRLISEIQPNAGANQSPLVWRSNTPTRLAKETDKAEIQILNKRYR